MKLERIKPQELEYATEEQVVELSKDSIKEYVKVMDERTPEKQDDVSDIDETMKASKKEVERISKSSIVESFLKENNTNYTFDNKTFNVNCVDRKELGKVVNYLKESNVNFVVKRSLDESFRYSITVSPKTTIRPLKEDKEKDKGIKHNPNSEKKFELDVE